MLRVAVVGKTSGTIGASIGEGRCFYGALCKYFIICVVVLLSLLVI